MKVTVIAFLFPFLLCSQDKEFALSLSVSSDNIIEARVKSTLSRLLREFRDVSLTDSYDCDYEIRIIVITNENKSGYQTGYTASVEILKPLTPFDFTFQIANRYREELNDESIISTLKYKQEIDTSYIVLGIADVVYEKGIYQPAYSSLLVDSELTSICERIVATIDTEVLEPDRIGFYKLLGR